MTELGIQADQHRLGPRRRVRRGVPGLAGEGALAYPQPRGETDREGQAE